MQAAALREKVDAFQVEVNDTAKLVRFNRKVYALAAMVVLVERILPQGE